MSMNNIISNNLGVKNFKEMNFGNPNQDRIVIIANANARPLIMILDATNKNEDERRELVNNALLELTWVCNYRYSIVSVVGNTYFCN